MRATREQIEKAAYHRWERRGRPHGGDRDDWAATEKDLTFGLNYRYLVRYSLDGPGVLLGKAESGRRRCRYCEQSGPSARFLDSPPLVDVPGNSALRAWDECDDCRGGYLEGLAGAFEAFARPWMNASRSQTPAAIPVGALKALVRMGLGILPSDELQHVGETVEWVSNPDHARDASTLADLGCHVYETPEPVASPFVAVARRVEDEAPWPYLVFFLATPRAVFQTHLPLCARDEDLDGGEARSLDLSMSMGVGPDHRASRCVYLPVARPRIFARGLVGAGDVSRGAGGGFS